MEPKKRIKLFLDMDNVLVDTLPALNKAAETLPAGQRPDQIPGIFRDLNPVDGAVESVKKLNDYFDLYILSTAPWINPSAWQDKVYWIKNIFGEGSDNPFYKKIVMTHDKGLVHFGGGILVDDRPYHGASSWVDEKHNSAWIQYGYDQKLVWNQELTNFLIEIAKENNDKILEAMNSSNNGKFQIHGDLTDFSKENWEKGDK